MFCLAPHQLFNLDFTKLDNAIYWDILKKSSNKKYDISFSQQGNHEGKEQSFPSL